MLERTNLKSLVLQSTISSSSSTSIVPSRLVSSSATSVTSSNDDDSICSEDEYENVDEIVYEFVTWKPVVEELDTDNDQSPFAVDTQGIEISDRRTSFNPASVLCTPITSPAVSSSIGSKRTADEL